MNREQYQQLRSELRSKSIDDAPLWPLSMRRTDELQKRLEMSRSIRKCAVAGKVIFESCGRDCDGYDWENSKVIPATLTHYLGAVKDLNDSADGPFACNWRMPDVGDLDCQMCDRHGENIYYGMVFCDVCIHEAA